MNNETLKIILEWYNQEKNILVNRLSNLSTCNETIATRYSIEWRLRQIDKNIKELFEKDN